MDTKPAELEPNPETQQPEVSAEAKQAISDAPDYVEMHAVADAAMRYSPCTQFRAENFIRRGYAVFCSPTEGFFVEYAALGGGLPVSLPGDSFRVRSTYG